MYYNVSHRGKEVGLVAYPKVKNVGAKLFIRARGEKFISKFNLEEGETPMQKRILFTLFTTVAEHSLRANFFTLQHQNTSTNTKALIRPLVQTPGIQPRTSWTVPQARQPVVNLAKPRTKWRHCGTPTRTCLFESAAKAPIHRCNRMPVKPKLPREPS